MGRLQRDDCRSGRRLHVLVHQHVLSGGRSELGHAHWVVQILILRRGTDSDSNGLSDSNCHSNRDAHRKRWYPDCHSNRDAHRNSNSHTHRDTDCNSNRRANCNSDCDANSNSDRNTNCYSDSHADSDPDPDSNADGLHANHYAERRHVYQSRDCAAFVRYVRRDDLLHHERRNPDH